MWWIVDCIALYDGYLMHLDHILGKNNIYVLTNHNLDQNDKNIHTEGGLEEVWRVDTAIQFVTAL